MKIIAQIPTGKHFNNNCGWSYTTELLEVEVKCVRRILRYKKDTRRKGYFYMADVIPPERIIPYACGMNMHQKGLYSLFINRRLNPKWKPPKFEDGVDYVDV